jgi:hypothetical protein
MPKIDKRVDAYITRAPTSAAKDGIPRLRAACRRVERIAAWMTEGKPRNWKNLKAK